MFVSQKVIACGRHTL